jgi:predicted short-subunit dehydrogenase-like oxidoreductase (DUF2520 family)
MRALDDSEAAAREAGERRAKERDEAARELAEHGIELDPLGLGEHRHGDEVHRHDHPHPHVHSAPGEKAVLGIVGAGRVGTALGIAFSRAGWPIAAVASRDADRRERFRQHVPGAKAFAEPNAIVDAVEVVFLAVPDDAIAKVAGEMRLYAGQALVHTSGLLGPEALAPAMAAGTQAGAFHPLVAFADLDRALASLDGATIAIEGDDQLAAMLAELAESIGSVPVRLAPGAKPAYHAAAVLAAGGVVALLDTIRELAARVGLDEAGALAIYLPLLEQTVGNARALGIAAALTGPTVRGDAGTLIAHRTALRGVEPSGRAVYQALVGRSIEVAEHRGAVSPEAAARLRAALAERS